MAKLPTQKRIEQSEVPRTEPRLLVFINAFADAVYTALSGNLTFSENFASQKKQLSFETLSDYSAGNFSQISFPKTIRTRAEGVILMQIYENGVSNYTPIKNGVYVDWYENAENIIIGFVTGLEDSTSYTMNVRVF